MTKVVAYVLRFRQAVVRICRDAFAPSPPTAEEARTKLLRNIRPYVTARLSASEKCHRLGGCECDYYHQD